MKRLLITLFALCLLAHSAYAVEGETCVEARLITDATVVTDVANADTLVYWIQYDFPVQGTTLTVSGAAIASATVTNASADCPSDGENAMTQDGIVWSYEYDGSVVGLAYVRINAATADVGDVTVEFADNAPWTATPTDTPIPPTPTDTPVDTDTPTNTPTNTNTPSNTPTITMTPSITNTPNNTSTPSFTPTDTPVDTNTPITNSPTKTPTMTWTPVNTWTPQNTFTPVNTSTPTVTATPVTTPGQLYGGIMTVKNSGAAALAWSIDPGGVASVREVRVHLSGAGTGNLMLVCDSVDGATWDTVLSSTDTSSGTDFVISPLVDGEWLLADGDILLATWANAGADTYGIEVQYHKLR